ncbi:MAG TPA: hypothetical protein VNH83_13385 [Bryobacteraceae bacterium]|nr:hypothetical protein [Bryobacteraceae bacterium]
MARRPRPHLAIRFDAWIFRNEHGYVARALELPVVSAPANTRRGAVKDLKDKMKTYLDELSEHDRLSSVIYDAGFRRWIGERVLKVNSYDSVSVTLPLPRTRPGQEL